MSLETSYEVLEMLRDDGVQTFRAKEKATGRGLELHLFPPFGRPENKTLFEKLKTLPLETRRKFLDIGVDGSTPYVVTDPLPGSGFKVWAEQLIGGTSGSSGFPPGAMSAGQPSRDDGVQILQAGQWRTGTPIPDSLITKPPVSRPTQPPAPPQTGDFTRMFQAPDFLSSPTPPAPQTPPPSAPVASAPPPSAPPPFPAAPPVSAFDFGSPAAPAGEFTGFFQAAEPAKPAAPAVFQETMQESSPSVGEFTGLFEANKPAAPAPLPSTPFVAPQPLAPPPVIAEPGGGEFTRMFQAPQPAAPPLAPAPPSASYNKVPDAFPQPEAGSGVEFTKYFENPLKPAPAGSSPQPMIELPPPPPPPTGGKRGGEFTSVFGRPSMEPSSPAAPGGFSFDAPAPQAPPPTGPVFGAMPSATGAFSAPPAWSQPQAPQSFPAGPSEYTRMMSAPGVAGDPGPSLFSQPPSAPLAPQAPVIAKKSNLPLFIAIGVVVLLVIGIVIFLLTRQPATIPAAK
jgi:hypothetical protein